MAASDSERLACEQALRKRCKCVCDHRFHGAGGIRDGVTVIASERLTDPNAYAQLPKGDPHRIPSAVERAIAAAVRREHARHKKDVARLLTPDFGYIRFKHPYTGRYETYPPSGEPPKVCAYCVEMLRAEQVRLAVAPASPVLDADGLGLLATPPTSVTPEQAATQLVSDLEGIARQLGWAEIEEAPADARSSPQIQAPGVRPWSVSSLWRKGPSKVRIGLERDTVRVWATTRRGFMSEALRAQLNAANLLDTPGLVQSRFRSTLLDAATDENVPGKAVDTASTLAARPSGEVITRERERCAGILRALVSRSMGAGRTAPAAHQVVESIRRRLVKAGLMPADASLSPLVDQFYYSHGGGVPAFADGEQTHPVLLTLRERAAVLAGRAGIPVPYVGLATEGGISACTFVHDDVPVILFSQRMLDILTPEELETILLHEIGHLVHAHGYIQTFFARAAAALAFGSVYPDFRPRDLRWDAEQRLAHDLMALFSDLSVLQETEADTYAAEHGDPQIAARTHALIRLHGLQAGVWSGGEDTSGSATHPGIERRIALVEDVVRRKRAAASAQTPSEAAPNTRAA